MQRYLNLRSKFIRVVGSVIILSFIGYPNGGADRVYYASLRKPGRSTLRSTDEIHGCLSDEYNTLRAEMLQIFKEQSQLAFVTTIASAAILFGLLKTKVPAGIGVSVWMLLLIKPG